MPGHLDALFADLPEKLKVKQVADLLGISTQVVYKWLENGTIPAYKVGSIWIILRDELKEAIREGSNAFTEADENSEESSLEGSSDG